MLGSTSVSHAEKSTDKYEKMPGCQDPLREKKRNLPPKPPNPTRCPEEQHFPPKPLVSHLSANRSGIRKSRFQDAHGGPGLKAMGLPKDQGLLRQPLLPTPADEGAAERDLTPICPFIGNHTH